LVEAVILATTWPEGLYRAVSPVPVNEPRWLAKNTDLAQELGLGAEWFEGAHSISVLAGNAPYPGQQTVALAYAGHQFGNWVPQLGDGRAHLIATLSTPKGPFELQLKGSGPTPYSRNGDGRAALGPMLREYLISEAMAGLRIPTTRSLAVVATGEEVYRRRKEPGGIVTRVAKSHTRVGTFQFLASRKMTDEMRIVADLELQRSYSSFPTGNQRFLWLLENVVRRQADLISKWMCVGFIHGVMNTDNMTLSGETIDYGPCAFIDTFHPKKVFSSIDEWGRYAWDQQPAIGLWNLTRLAEALLPLIDSDQDKAVERAKEALSHFYPTFERAFETGMMAKLGATALHEDDGTFIAATLTALLEEKADFTLFFRAITKSSGDILQSPKIAEWMKTWKARVPNPDRAMMQSHNPVYIARNHQVEAALAEAEIGNMTRFDTLCQLLKTPYVEQQNMSLFEMPPLPEEEVHATFCGT
jgi:serine/tyrosine/threonine adenylyltransferase